MEGLNRTCGAIARFHICIPTGWMQQAYLVDVSYASRHLTEPHISKTRLCGFSIPLDKAV